MIKNFFLFLLIFILIPIGVKGAVLYLEPAEGEYQPSDTFMVDVRIDTEGECINTVKADLNFSQDLLKAVDFSQGDSILTLWVEGPKIDQGAGLISFTGGIPGGYCGRIPGDPGASNLLGNIIFKTQETRNEQQAKVEFLDSSQVLLNDGLGTPAKLTTRGANFTILAEKLEEVPKDEWQEELEKDKIPPETFVIEVRQDPAVFEGKYFLIFSTTDKQTGLDYFEVQEGEMNWEKTISPYLLKDQSLQSIIRVRAVDKAGNERIVEVGPPKPLPPPEKKPFLWWIIIVVLLIGAVIWRIVKRISTKPKRN